MPTPEEDPRFLEALDQLGRGEDAVASALLTSLAAKGPLTPAAHLATLLSHALSGRWSEVERVSRAWPGGPLQTLPALRALALAADEPTEEALRVALEGAWLPARPIPEAGDDSLHRLWTLWEGPLFARLIEARGAPPRGAPVPGNGPGASDAPEATPPRDPPDPFSETLLGLLDPRPVPAAARLSRAVEAGLDLAPVRLALARLLRRAGDPGAALAALDEIPPSALEAPWSERLVSEREACARDAELGRATRVVLRLGDATRTLCQERGLYLTVEAGSSPDRWVRLVESDPVGPALRNLVNDHLAAGWTVAELLLDPADAELSSRLEEALERGDYPRAISLGRLLMQRQPEDATLASKVLVAAVGARGPVGAIELSQRALLLGGEPSSALRRHAALLYGAGSVEECLGTLWYLEDHHGPETLSPASHALLAGCHLVPRFRPTIAGQLLSAGLARFPGHPALIEMKARLQLFDRAPAAALDSLAPLLAATRPAASVMALGLQALLEEDAGSAEPLARRARALHPGDLLLEALSLEVASRVGPALAAYEQAVEAAPGPLASLELQLCALRAACRMSAFEDALRLARRTQTLLGEPDPRCLDVIYESLTALEPGEHREDLAAIAEEARRRSAARLLASSDRLAAQLATGFFLDPALLDPLWARWTPPDAASPLPAASPEPMTALIPLASDTGCVAFFDARGLAPRLASPPWNWLSDPALLAEEREAGRLVVAPLPAQEGPRWLRVTTLAPMPAHRFRKSQEATLGVPSGKVFAGPGEVLLGAPEASLSSTALAVELGGRFRLLPPGRYQVTVWHALPGPWPPGEVGADPADVVVQIGSPGTR